MTDTERDNKKHAGNQSIFLPGLISILLLVSFTAPMTVDAETATKRFCTGLTASASDDGLPRAWAAPVDTAPAIDGILNDHAWSSTRAVLLGGLTGHETVRPQSRAWLVNSGGRLFIGMHLEEPNISGLHKNISKPDGPLYRDDSVELFLSPFPDRGYFQFIISASGAVYDRKNHGNPAAFDAGARAKTAIHKDSWSMEAVIPIPPMTAGRRMPVRWRANVYRNRRAGPEGQNQAWSPPLCPDYDVPKRFGHLLFTPTSPWAGRENASQKKYGIEVEEPNGGGTVLSFDLSSLPGGTHVYRARLFFKRRTAGDSTATPPGAIEIYPVRGPRRGGAPPETAGKPLSPASPWYNSFDMTDLVNKWMKGSLPRSVYVKNASGWRRETTHLDVMFKGDPEELPPQVTGVNTFHRSGQTFITWKEINDPVKRDVVRWRRLKSILEDLDREREIRYCVYRSGSPITRDNLNEAECIASVSPLSCWNINGRTIARPIDEHIAEAETLNWHQWNPFRDASVDGPYGLECPIDRFVIRRGEPPLPRRTGLYVHTAVRNEQAYYTVVTRIDGVENTHDINTQNAPRRPVNETAADPQPVLQGELPPMPFFNYKQKRLHFVRWVSEPFTNKPYEYFNWSAGIPLNPGRAAPLELNLHRDGYGYWRTHYRIEPGSIVICPHDFPLKTWWYGCHEACGTLRSWSDGVIRNYTEKRLLWFVNWAASKWPVDRNRILVTGCNGGASGSGALHLGLRYPQIFNMAIAGHGEPDYMGTGDACRGIWGGIKWNLKANTGRSIWDELDLLRHVTSLSRTTELPFISMTYSERSERTKKLVEALESGTWPVVTHTAWGGQRMVPVSAASTHWSVPLDIRKDRSMLAVRTVGKTGDAVHNGSLLWRTGGMVDEPERYAVTINQTAASFTGTVTLRRLQQFRVVKDATYAWRIEPHGQTKQSRGKPLPAREGKAATGEEPVLTITIKNLPKGMYRLTVVPEHQE